MFEKVQLVGLSLPPRTLVLTFDDGPGATDEPDGPGPRTLPLAAYLSEQDIPATFFACGKHLEELPWVPDRLRALGHTVANHSFSHPRLTDISLDEVAGELEQTHPLLCAAVAERSFFRAPYGACNAEIAEALNDRLSVAASYIGPVHWDIDVEDWSFWQRGLSARECADAFVDEVERVGRGIVLMHDSTADLPDVKLANQAFAMVRLLVPALRARGYEFVGLEDVPAIAERLA